MIKITNENTVPHEPSVHRPNRERTNKHKSIIIWFTGLSASGKSTLANALEAKLHNNNVRTYVLDGDNIRQGLCKDLGFSDEDRTENIRRIGEVSKLMMEAGIIVITAFISPFTKDRKIVRELVEKGEFIEVFCNASIDVCESRDLKGLYLKARAGDLSEFTGISSPYEKPVNSEIELDTDKLSVQDCIDKLISYLLDKNIFEIT